MFLLLPTNHIFFVDIMVHVGTDDKTHINKSHTKMYLEMISWAKQLPKLTSKCISLICPSGPFVAFNSTSMST